MVDIYMACLVTGGFLVAARSLASIASEREDGDELVEVEAPEGRTSPLRAFGFWSLVLCLFGLVGLLISATGIHLNAWLKAGISLSAGLAGGCCLWIWMKARRGEEEGR